MKRAIATVVSVLIAANVFAADKLKVITSIRPLYNITKAIAGDAARVTVMVPPGMSPHMFSPKPSQLADMAKADIFIRVGAGLEYWSDKIIQASGNKKLKIITITDGMKLDGGDADSPSGNPHVWLDPVIARSFSVEICNALVSADPANAVSYKKNLSVFSKALEALDKETAANVKKFRIKELVSFHPSWYYFLKRYGLKEVASIEAVPGREPSAKEIKGIIELVKKYKIKAVFAETTLPRKAADVIASEAGVKVLILNPEGGEGDDYVSFIRKNIVIMEEAMK
jgi:zinc transport system substrate-binding protein